VGGWMDGWMEEELDLSTYLKLHLNLLRAFVVLIFSDGFMALSAGGCKTASCKPRTSQERQKDIQAVSRGIDPGGQDSYLPVAWYGVLRTRTHYSGKRGSESKSKQ
jgi:hypothetical protein